MFSRLLRVHPDKVQRTEASYAFKDGRAFEVRFTHHARARRLRLSVGDEGVRVTVPPRVSERTVDQFILSHLDWIREHLDKMPAPDTAPVQLFETTQLPLRGEHLAIAWRHGKTDKVWREHATVHVQVRGDATQGPASATLKRAFRDFYLNEARADVGRWLPALAEATGHSPVRISYKIMRTQWGSMSSRGVMALELSLVLGRPDAFRYVLVHELCHMRHHDHSPAFWREVEKHFPEWQDERAFLHTHGRGMKAALKAFIA